MDRLKQITAKVIRERRKNKGLGYGKLAEKSGVAVRYLVTVEKGESLPSLHTLLRIAQALEISLGELVTEIEERLDEEEDNKE